MSLVLPLIAFAVATAGLVLLVEPFLAWYFQWAWWSYVLAVDALNHRLGGPSLVRERPADLLRLCALSILFWTFFEALNLRLGNWYYVMDHPVLAVRWAGGLVAFATVLPGILLTEALLARIGRLRQLRVRPLGWSRGRDATCLVLGATCLLLPLAGPDVFFPLTWGAVALLLEPWNRRHARRSFLRDLETGEAGPLVRTLVAGLLCGVLWETWNFWARTKWIYTVPGFESFKVFEMPLAGFLGFPPFALCCVVFARFAESLWERMGGLPAGRRRGLRLGTVTAAVMATLAVFTAADVVTVDSHYAPVERLEVLPPRVRESLSRAGLRSPEILLRTLAGAEGPRAWSERTGIPAEELRLHRERVALVMHRGLGDARARELAPLGIRTRDDLRDWTPERLAAALRARGARGPGRFLERRVRVWLEGLEPERAVPASASRVVSRPRL